MSLFLRLFRVREVTTGHRERVSEGTLDQPDQRSVRHVCMRMNTHKWNESDEISKTQFVDNRARLCKWVSSAI